MASLGYDPVDPTYSPPGMGGVDPSYRPPQGSPFGIGAFPGGPDARKQDWRQTMNLPLQQFGSPGDIGFAGIQPPQAPPPGISELLASIPNAKKPRANREQSAILNRFAETGGGAPLRAGATGDMMSAQQRRRMMNQRSTGTHR